MGEIKKYSHNLFIGTITLQYGVSAPQFFTSVFLMAGNEIVLFMMKRALKGNSISSGWCTK
jgi:hypothetical protein